MDQDEKLTPFEIGNLQDNFFKEYREIMERAIEDVKKDGANVTLRKMLGVRKSVAFKLLRRITR
jgi:hypothetical protein